MLTELTGSMAGEPVWIDPTQVWNIRCIDNDASTVKYAFSLRDDSYITIWFSSIDAAKIAIDDWLDRSRL